MSAAVSIRPSIRKRVTWHEQGQPDAAPGRLRRTRTAQPGSSTSKVTRIPRATLHSDSHRSSKSSYRNSSEVKSPASELDGGISGPAGSAGTPRYHGREHELEQLYSKAIHDFAQYDALLGASTASHETREQARESSEISTFAVQLVNEQLPLRDHAPPLTSSLLPHLTPFVEDHESLADTVNGLSEQVKWREMHDLVMTISRKREDLHWKVAGLMGKAQASLDTMLKQYASEGEHVHGAYDLDDRIDHHWSEYRMPVSKLISAHDTEIAPLCQSASYWAQKMSLPLTSLDQVDQGTALAMGRLLRAGVYSGNQLPIMHSGDAATVSKLASKLESELEMKTAECRSTKSSGHALHSLVELDTVERTLHGCRSVSRAVSDRHASRVASPDTGTWLRLL